MSAVTLTADSLRAKLFDFGIDVANADILIADATYALPSKAWVEGDFADKFSDFCKEYVGPYTSESADCDDFADAGAFFARSCHREALRESGDAPRSTAPAFGEFWYTTGAGVGHAINVFFCYSGEELEMCFFEPQLGQLVNLSKEEKASCGFLRL